MNKKLREAADDNKNTKQIKGFVCIGDGDPHEHLSSSLGVDPSEMYSQENMSGNMHGGKNGDGSTNPYYVKQGYFSQEALGLLTPTDALVALQEGEKVMNENGKRVYAIRIDGEYKIMFTPIKVGDLVKEDRDSKDVFLVVGSLHHNAFRLVLKDGLKLLPHMEFTQEELDRDYEKVGAASFPLTTPETKV